MESSVLFNIDENIWHPMDDDSAGNGSQEMVLNTESPQAETAEEWKSVLFDQFGVVDLSRMPPRVFLTLAQARTSIREELRGILAKDNAGIPIGELIWLSDERFTKLPKVRTTMVTKLKANGVFKSRICLRGDTMPMIHQQFASAPTVRKEYLRLFCSLFVNISTMIWLQVDISKAFLQSDYLHPKDKVIALLPEYVGLTGLVWEGWLAVNHTLSSYAKDHPDDGKKVESFQENLTTKSDKIGMLLNRPLYGSTDAPLRWYITITRALKRQDIRC